MATLALSLAGQVVGGLFGPVGATVGRALGALAGNAIDGLLFGQDSTSAAASDVRLQGSSEGGAIPRLYGWNRVSGNIIWARELELLDAEGGGAKGFGNTDEDAVGASFAVAFCEGEVHRLGRIWADGQLLETDGLSLRFYRGTPGQLPDSLIEATQGVGATPAYRGICYLVFEQLPLSRFGNRIPQISVELCRVVGALEPAVRAVTLIPGATEFGYDPTPRVRLVSKGETLGENTHMAANASDWTLSLDELQALCPNLQKISLVVAWFGDDLRCGHCTIGPRVENASRTIEGTVWSVAGLGRGDVPVVSRHDGGPAYGGTPSDNAVLAAITDLKARGLGVTLYPIILMDIAQGNDLPDPYSGGTGQATYPWRGRISCTPAPGQAGTPDQTGAIAAQLAPFVSAYRAMVLHYAQLAQQAGGVDALLLGSEMRGMTTLRDAGNGFPFVAALVALAADVRAIVGAGTKLSYGADWSEYSGYQAGGAKFFHLDPLWASNDIDAVGIDNYLPLCDWRDGLDHADAALADSPYDLDYLRRNIAGGEGYDWYYASTADRIGGVRTAISDGAHGEPWIYRAKDIRSWWSHAHYDRPDGVRAASPTAWVPGGKPIWFTELGCGAVDKGANQPNVFADAKSAEGGLPYFSSGGADALAQRQFIRAHQQFWADPANNPAGMVDTARLYLWTWDARPYPAFPQLSDVWADGVNYATGHWLNGRLGGAASDELALAIAADYGVTLGGVAAAAPFIEGYRLGEAMSARDALAPLVQATGLLVRDDGMVRLDAAGRAADMRLELGQLAATDRPMLARRRNDPGAGTGRLALSYGDRLRDYQTATVTALRDADGALAAEASTLVLSSGGARMVAERLLSQTGLGLETLDLALPPSAATLETGDLLDLAGVAGGPFQITEIRDGALRTLSARSLPNGAAVTTSLEPPRAGGGNDFARSLPLVAVAQLPPEVAGDGQPRLAVAAYAKPWPGTLSISDDSSARTLVQVTRRGAIGELTAALGAGPVGVWDRASLIEVQMTAGHLASADPVAVLAGSNRLAMENDAGAWEVIGFADAALIAPGRYRLTTLLRGLAGTGFAIGPAAIGRTVIRLDERVQQLPLAAQWLGETLALRVFAGAADLTGTALAVATGLAPVLPLAPVHPRAWRGAGGDIGFSWVRCSRSDDDGWAVTDAPLELAPERYLLTVRSAGVLVRQFDVGALRVTYAAADQMADFGALPSSFDFEISQVSPVHGPGPAATGVFDGERTI